jgi:phosphonate transport system substrate-binding protein
MSTKIFSRLAAGLGAAVAAFAIHAQEISFGIISTESTQTLKQNWQPIIDAMNRETGLKVTAFFASDYAGIIEGMRFNKVQVAWFGNKSAMEAVDRSNGEVFAKVINADGTEGYYSHLIVHRDSPLKNLDDVLRNGRNLSFGNGDPNSTSGFLVPAFYVFANHKIDAKTHFKFVRAANHETNALAVANRQVDVATNNSENLAKLEKNLPDKHKDVRTIWTSPLIASDPIVMRKDLSEATKAKIRGFFLNYAKTDPREKEVMARMNWSAFKASNDAQLLPIRQLDLYNRKSKLEADTTVADEDRKIRLAEIDRKLAELK